MPFNQYLYLARTIICSFFIEELGKMTLLCQFYVPENIFIDFFLQILTNFVVCTLLSVAISNHSVVSLLFPIYFQCYSSFSASNLPLFSLLSCSLSIFLFTRMFRSSSQTLTLIVVSCQLANLRVFSKNRP